MKCQRCDGKGWHYAILRDIGHERDGCGTEHVVPCDAPACRNGEVTKESLKYYYKVTCGIGG